MDSSIDTISAENVAGQQESKRCYTQEKRIAKTRKDENTKKEEKAAGLGCTAENRLSSFVLSCLAT
jgi:hypothetical protein